MDLADQISPADAGSLLITRVPETLRSQVVDRLRSAICDQRFPQGSRLVERQLCLLLGVSRTLVREALRQLEAEGFVVGNPRTGPSVARLDRDTVQSIYEVRAALEALAGKLFVERATATDRARLQQAFETYQAASRGTDAGLQLQTTALFYDAIFAGARNGIVVATLRPLSGRISMLRARSMSVKGRRAVAQSEMGAIYRALLGDEPAKAWACCWDHVMNALSCTLQTFETEQGAASHPQGDRSW